MGNHEQPDDWTVNSGSWHFQLYQIAVAMWSSWTEAEKWRYKNANLCIYVRMITLYFPMMLVIFGGILTSPIWIFYIMVKWYGSGTVIAAFWAVVKVVGWIVLVISMIIAVLYLWSKAREIHPIEAIKSMLPKKDVRQLELVQGSAQVKEKTFFQLFIQWWQDKHGLVCRPITVVDSNLERSEKGKTLHLKDICLHSSQPLGWQYWSLYFLDFRGSLYALMRSIQLMSQSGLAKRPGSKTMRQENGMLMQNVPSGMGK